MQKWLLFIQTLLKKFAVLTGQKRVFYIYTIARAIFCGIAHLAVKDISDCKDNKAGGDGKERMNKVLIIFSGDFF